MARDVPPAQSASEIPQTSGHESTGMERELVEVPDIGLTKLLEPKDPQTIIADIIFVHGLGGHPRNAWTFKKPVSRKWRKGLGKAPSTEIF